MTVAIIIGTLALGNLSMIWLWRRAAQKAMLADTYATMLSAIAKENSKQREALARKEDYVKVIEKALVDTLTTPELVDKLNRMFPKAGGN